MLISAWHDVHNALWDFSPCCGSFFARLFELNIVAVSYCFLF